MNKDLNQELPVYLASFNLFDFDTSSIEKRYRIVSDTCDIEINGNVKRLVDYIRSNEGETSASLIDGFNGECNANRKELENTFSLLFKKGLLNHEKQKEKDGEKEESFRNKMEHLWLRVRLIDTEKHAQFFRFFSFVFSRSFAVAFVSAFLICDAAFVSLYFFSAWRQSLIYYSAFDYFYLFVFFSCGSVFLHEAGHIAAAKRFNAKTGGIGFGIYYYLLVAYADIHETWNLPRSQRRIVSIAGFYWNMISVFPLFFLCFILRSRAIADFLLLFHLSFIGIFDPFLKMDGYWFLCDTLGVPNLQTRIRTYLFRFLPSKLFGRGGGTVDPFYSYPKKVLSGVKVYMSAFVVFMVAFLSLFLLKAVNIGLHADAEVISPFRMIFAKWDTALFNHLLRNAFILFGAIMLIVNLAWKYTAGFFRKLLSQQAS